MGLFSKKPVETVEGIVDRIGITHFSDVTQGYTVVLRDGRFYEIDSGVGAAKNRRVNPDIALAKPGDVVTFGVKQGDWRGHGHFRNLTMKPLATDSKP